MGWNQVEQTMITRYGKILTTIAVFILYTAILYCNAEQIAGHCEYGVNLRQR